MVLQDCPMIRLLILFTFCFFSQWLFAQKFEYPRPKLEPTMKQDQIWKLTSAQIKEGLISYTNKYFDAYKAELLKKQPHLTNLEAINLERDLIVAEFRDRKSITPQEIGKLIMGIHSRADSSLNTVVRIHAEDVYKKLEKRIESLEVQFGVNGNTPLTLSEKETSSVLVRVDSELQQLKRSHFYLWVLAFVSTLLSLLALAALARRIFKEL